MPSTPNTCHCGTVNHPDSQFCLGCGQELARAGAVNLPIAARATDFRLWGSIIVGLAFVVGLLIGAVFTFSTGL